MFNYHYLLVVASTFTVPVLYCTLPEAPNKETACCLALQVSALAARLKQAEKDAALYNSREALFGKPTTDYSEVKKLWESFEPYQQFWSIAAAWKVCNNTTFLAPTNASSYVTLAS